jgi:hypothetical protein
VKNCTLQINDGDIWRDVLHFEHERIHEVEDAAASLSRAAGGLRLRIVGADIEHRYLNENGVFRELNQGQTS